MPSFSDLLVYRKLIPLHMRYRFSAIFRYPLLWCMDTQLRKYKSRLESLQGKYKGSRCFVMGNGPSLNKTPLEKLDGEFVWGANRCNLLFDRISWRPKFYTAIDTRVVPDNSDEIIGLMRSLPKTSFFFPWQFRLSGVLTSFENTYWYNEIQHDDCNLPFGYFSTDVPNYVYSAPTVTIAALQLAVHLGFNPIYLIGCDTNYSVPDSVEYEDSKKELILAQKDDDTSHFAQNYFGKGKKYHQPYPERMMFGYSQAKAVCDQIGVSIINATIGGKLEVFPRAVFSDLFDD